ncbi:hypothetical protein O3S81_24265 [Agrobacterium sp. SOY23]|uniref:hypothetical protein n=1 Tax=Agrobacterium sp. SOY23 TaxID=3014555 RepID=UPI0022AFB662|nr:hypothetical protein [Agrobacterium sp. SOY23]MCZ4432837.1 hypothetical protein [Agrobacterium sp. SOY23]
MTVSWHNSTIRCGCAATGMHLSSRRAKQETLFLSIYCLTIMMLKIPAFPDLWRGWRHAVKKYLSFSGTGFHAATSPLPSANSDNLPDDPWETDGARPPVSWLGLGQSFSAVDVAGCDGSERSRLPTECG